MVKNKDNEKPQDKNEEGIPIYITTQTGRIKMIGTIVDGELDTAKRVMIEAARFLKNIDECEGYAGVSEQLTTDMLNNVINSNFEVGLIADYAVYKIDDRTYNYYHIKTLIERFVKTIGLTNLSYYFQTEWNKMQPVTYCFGPTEFVVGKNAYSSIDILIDLLDELDDRRSALGEDETLPDYHMLQLRSALKEWSPVILTLDELIRMSDVEDKSCSGCEFVRKLVDRVGLENLPLKTKELYTKVFLPN